MKPVNTTLHTVGDGYWSREARDVRITGLDVAYENDEGSFGELRVSFNPQDWDIDQHGLIYTDSQWIQELRAYLAGFLGLDCSEIDYSEQGMQGDDYVSLDVEESFLRSWHQLFG